MFNFELLFLHGFSSKHRKILHKAVLTLQEYEDFFGREIGKNGGKSKKLVGVFSQVKISLKINLLQKNFLNKILFEKTPPNSKKKGSKSVK